MHEEPDVIHFYKVDDPYGEFSNFAPFPIELDGKTWPTSEHYFQAQKFPATPHEEQIRLAATPSEAAKRGRDRRKPLREDWEHVKFDVMRKAVLAKFRQHAKLRRLLLSTGSAMLVEHTSRDAIWGDGGDGHGMNWLGRILMEVRETLRHEAATDGQGFTVQRLDHLVLTVADIGRTCEFYTRVLGMKVVTFGEGRTALHFGQQKINLHPYDLDNPSRLLVAAQPTPGSGDLCFITMTPLDQVIAHLRLCGVELEAERSSRTGALGPIESVYFRDPDNNLIEVSNYP